MIKKIKKVRKPRKSSVPKTRNNGSMTESAFFGWLRQILRKSSMYWKPIAQVRKEAQVLYKGPNKRRKFSYICSECRREVDGKSIHIHHKIDCGSLRSFADLSEFAERLFCEKDLLSAICNTCHDKIHGKNLK